MKKLLPFLLVFFFCFISGKAQNLNPNESIFDSPYFSFDYHSNVRNLLFQNISERPILRFVVMPSFLSEYVFQIDENDKNEFIAIVNISEESIWESEQPYSVKIRQFSSKVVKEDVQILYDAYKKLLKNTYFSSSNMTGLDGDIFILSIWNPDYMSGNRWSPRDEISKNIIEISERLASEIISEKKNVSLKREEKEFLMKFLNTDNRNSDIDDLKLALRLIECIEERRDFYASQLPEIALNTFEKSLEEFKREMFLRMASGALSNQYLHNILNKYENQILKLLEIHRNNPTIQLSEEVLKDYKMDNLFKKLLEELN